MYVAKQAGKNRYHLHDGAPQAHSSRSAGAVNGFSLD